MDDNGNVSREQLKDINQDLKNLYEYQDVKTHTITKHNIIH